VEKIGFPRPRTKTSLNTITIVLILIVLIITAIIGLALAGVLRSIAGKKENRDDDSMSVVEREKHIDSLLKKFEEQMGQTGDQDERNNSA
jgi:hypothetical protein